MRKNSKRRMTAAMACFCAAVLLSACPPRAFAASSATARTTDYLNLREGAGTNSKVILTLGKNVSLTILDDSDAQWAKVKTVSGKVGYCFKQYLTKSGNSGTNAAPASSGNGKATVTDYLRLRRSASTGGDIITVIAKGTVVTVLDNSNSQWVKVQLQNGTQGWCSRAYLSMPGNASTQPSAPAGTSASGVTAMTTDFLRLRESASLSAKAILILSKGASLTVLDNSNAQWVKVRTQSGKQGWCSRQYLSISGGTAPCTTSSQTSSEPQNASSEPASSGSDGSGAPQDGDGGNSDTKTITGATVMADVLRLRESAGTGAKILANLTRGTSLTVLEAPASGWIKVRTPDGKTGYVSAEFVQLQYSDGTTSNNGSTGTNASGLFLSSNSQSVPLGKTLYLKATTNPEGAGVAWTSSNSSVAKVTNGYVEAVGKGSAVITASSGSCKATCSVTVTDAEPVRIAYATPNVVGPGEAVTLTAVTDTARDGVRFVITLPGGGTRTVTASSSQQETAGGVTTKRWTASTTFSEAGNYPVVAQSSVNGSFSSAGFSTSAYVSTQSDYTVSTSEQRRASDKIIQLISQWEGYRAAVYTDTMSSGQVPTIGYGCTLNPNAVFYNNISQTEAWAMMVNKINAGPYTSELNKMIQNNHFLMNQNQFDCLISFGYNVGPYYFNSSNEMDFIKIMKNAVVPPEFSSGTMYEATVTKDTVVRESTGIMSNTVADISAGTAVEVTGGSFTDTRDGWYHVQLSDNTVGWINSGYVSFANSASLVHDLNYTNAYAFGTELIRWNQAGGKFYTGLFYRRLGEANVYNYNDYSALRTNKYGYGYPSSAASLS